MVSCLLIDRNEAERARIAAMLAQAGITCGHSDSAEEGLRYCRNNRPDIVVMDASEAPSAKQFLRLVRYPGHGPKRPVVIFYSSRPDLETMGETILEGAADFLMKPFDGELLLFKITQAGIALKQAA